MAKVLDFYCVTSCSTCKKAKSWLEEEKVCFAYHDLLKDLPSLSELKKLAKQADLSVKELVNTKSQAYKKIKPDLNGMNEQEIFMLISENPRILVRPLLSNGQKLLTGFKEEQYRAYIK
jgi:Spx/MgsR family transcriptional regulator